MSTEIYKNGDRGFNNTERENNVEHCVLVTKPIDPPSTKYPALYNMIHGSSSASNVLQDFSLHGFEKKNDDSLTIKYNTHYSGMSTNVRSRFSLVTSPKTTTANNVFEFVNAPEVGLLLNTKQNYLPKQLYDETEYTIEGIDNSNLRNWKGYFDRMLPDENYLDYKITNLGLQNAVAFNFCVNGENNYLKPNEVQYTTTTDAICTSSISGAGMAIALYNDNYAASAITARRPESYSNSTWYQNVAIDYTDEANLHRLKLGYTAIISGDNLDYLFNNDHTKSYQNIYAIGIKGCATGGDDSNCKMITKFYTCNSEQDSHFEKLQLLPKRLRENVYLIEDDEFKYIDVDHDEYINKSREYMIAKRDADNKLIFYDYFNQKWTDDRKLSYLTAFNTQSDAQAYLDAHPVDADTFVTAVNRFALGQMYMIPSISSCTAAYPYGNVPYETIFPVWYKIKQPYDTVSELVSQATYDAMADSAYYKIYKGTYRTQDFEHYRPEDYDKVFINDIDLGNLPDETFIFYRKNKTTNVITYYSGSKSIATADYDPNAWTSEDDKNTNDIYNATVLCNSASNDDRSTELLNYISGKLSSTYDVYRRDYEYKHIITRYNVKEQAIVARESLSACSAFSGMLQLYKPIDSDFRTTKTNWYYTDDAAYPEDRLYMPIGSGARVIAFDYSLTRVPDIPMADNTLRFKFRDLSFDPTVFNWKEESYWTKVEYTDGNVWDYHHPAGNDDFSREFYSKLAHNGNIELGDAELVSANIHPTATSSMFAGCNALTRVASIDTSRCVNASYMFNNCGALTSIGELDFSNVSSMEHAFEFCQELTAIPDFTCTNKIENVNLAFCYCSNAHAGISAAYQQISAYASSHILPFYKCSKNLGAGEMNVIPDDWK